MPASLRFVLAALLLPLLVVGGFVAAWKFDTDRREGTVGRNVEVAGIDLEGMGRAEVEAVGARLSEQVAGSEVVVSTGRQLLPTTAGALGASVDVEQLADEAMAARGGGPLLTQPIRWAASFFQPVELESAFVVDEQAVAAEMARLTEQLPKVVEPRLVLAPGEVRAIPGSEGQTLEAPGVVAAAAAELRHALSRPPPRAVSVDPVTIPPTTDFASLQAVADDANTTATGPITVVVEDQQTTLETEELRSWIRLDHSGPTPTWSFDSVTAVASLAPRFSDLGPEDQRAYFDVVDGRPVIVPAANVVVCCSEDSAARIAEALRSGQTEVTLDTTIDPDDPGTAELQALGIVEEVSSFTTNHACCENRVRNIQRFADLVRGQIIPPGGRLSLNGVVGERTEAKGFLPAGAIADGVLEPQVGGGVSQFSTTFFNAAFFAGLDWEEYQAHSLYFSRYPRGREATISWPKPDQVVLNNTPYGILVWPTYTDTSITVTLYSTRNVEVEDLGRTETEQGACTRVTTTRQRTWADGMTEQDSVFAVYRPREGVDCSGNPTRRAQEGK